MAGGSGQQGGDPQTYLPGPIPTWERDPFGPRAPHREDCSDAPRPQGEPAGALFTGRPSQKEDGSVTMLRSRILLHTLG